MAGRAMPFLARSKSWTRSRDRIGVSCRRTSQCSLLMDNEGAAYFTFRVQEFSMFNDLLQNEAPFTGLNHESIDLGGCRLEVLIAKDSRL